MDEIVKKRIKEHKEAIEMLLSDDKLTRRVSEMADCVIESLKRGGQLLICGNGGSAADSQHLATELVSRFYKERKAMNAEALTVNTSTITAIGNDYSFDRIFARQIEAKAKKEDVVLGISTSGNSKDVLMAFEKAKELGVKCIGFTGERHCDMDGMCDLVFHAPSVDTPRIQEMHILVGHIICEIVEEKLG